jgi:hypothetical protein
MLRLWIVTYADWRPTRWNEPPPSATAVELVEDALYSADEAALFLEGFNESMLEHRQPIWAVALPITIRYDGDAQAGMSVRGYAFADVMAKGVVTDTLRDPFEPDHFQGFGQSPQRSR